MSIPGLSVLEKFAHIILSLFESEAPAVGQAAAAAAVGAVESDPKVAAVTTAASAFVGAAKDLKTAIDAAKEPQS
jgi:hypothetical protein